MESTLFEIFRWLCFATGAAILFAAMLGALGWALMKALEYLRVWNVLLLCVGVQAHGREYRDQLFWRAIRERAEVSRFAADSISKFAMRHAPAIGAEDDDEFPTPPTSEGEK